MPLNARRGLGGAATALLIAAALSVAGCGSGGSNVVIVRTATNPAGTTASAPDGTVTPSTTTTAATKTTTTTKTTHTNTTHASTTKTKTKTTKHGHKAKRNHVSHVIGKPRHVSRITPAAGTFCRQYPLVRQSYGAVSGSGSPAAVRTRLVALQQQIQLFALTGGARFYRQMNASRIAVRKLIAAETAAIAGRQPSAAELKNGFAALDKAIGDLISVVKKACP